MGIKIVTGYTGEPHITATDDRLLNIGLFGLGDPVVIVLNGIVGDRFRGTLSDRSTFEVGPGTGILYGMFFRIPHRETESVTLEPLESGYKRIDRVVVEYRQDLRTGIESVGLNVITGTPTTGTPVVPALTHTLDPNLAPVKVAQGAFYKITLTDASATVEPEYVFQDALRGMGKTVTTLRTYVVQNTESIKALTSSDGSDEPVATTATQVNHDGSTISWYRIGQTLFVQSVLDLKQDPPAQTNYELLASIAGVIAEGPYYQTCPALNGETYTLKFQAVPSREQTDVSILRNGSTGGVVYAHLCLPFWT